MIQKAWDLSGVDTVGEERADKDMLKAAEQIELTRSVTPYIQKRLLEKGVVVVG